MFSTMKDNKSMYLNKPSKILHKYPFKERKVFMNYRQNIKKRNFKILKEKIKSCRFCSKPNQVLL